MMGLATVESRYLDGRASLICGDNTAGQIDEEVLKMITDAYAKAKELLTENMESLDKISEYLFEHETITGKEFMKIFREIKGLPDPDEEKEKDKSSDYINSGDLTKHESIFEEDDSKDANDSIFDE